MCPLLVSVLPMQGVQSKKDTPKGYVPPWKRVNEKQTKDGSKSSPKPAESMTASRMSSLSEHASVKPRKTPLSSGAAPSRKTGSRSAAGDPLSSVRPDQALPLDQNTLMRLLQSMQLQVQQKSISPFVATPPVPVTPPQPPPPPPPAPPPLLSLFPLQLQIHTQRQLKSKWKRQSPHALPPKPGSALKTL